MKRVSHFMLLPSLLLGALGCATHHRIEIQLVSTRLDSNTILIQVCNRADKNVVKVPRFNRKQILQLPASQSGDTIDLVWFPQRYRDVIEIPGPESYEMVATDSCMSVLMVDGDNRRVKYMWCKNLFHHGSITVLPVTGTIMFNMPPLDDEFIGGLGRP